MTTLPTAPCAGSWPRSSTSSLAMFVRLAERGAEGTFTARHRVVGEGPFGEGAGVVEVAHAPRPVIPHGSRGLVRRRLASARTGSRVLNVYLVLPLRQ